MFLLHFELVHIDVMVFKKKKFKGFNKINKDKMKIYK